VRLKEEVAAGLTFLRQNGTSWSVTVVSSEAPSAVSLLPFSLPFESKNSILST
jgi:hypothetical protein